MRTLKRVALPVLVIAVLIAAAFWGREYFMGREGPARGVIDAEAEVPPPGWTTVPEERTSSAAEELNPLHRRTEADEVMRDWPTGSRVVHVDTAEGEHVEIGVLPGGEVAAPEGRAYDITVFYKPEPAVAFEVRPLVGGGLSTGGPSVVAGVDVVRAWNLHAGPAVAVDFPERNVSAVAAIGWNVWRNVDVRVAGGYGTGGGVVSAGVTLALQ